MARPARLGDVEKWKLDGDTLVTVHDGLKQYPELMVAFYAALTVASDVEGLTVSDGSLKRDKTNAELMEVLERAQREWDKNFDELNKALDDKPFEAGLTKWRRDTLKTFAKKEGLDYPLSWDL